MAASDSAGDDSLYPIAVLIDELKNEDVQVSLPFFTVTISVYPYVWYIKNYISFIMKTFH